MKAKLDTRAMIKASAVTGVILYLLCLAFYLLVYGGRGSWMIRPFMPGVTNTVPGYLLGLVWALFYGVLVPGLLTGLYNRFVRVGTVASGAGGEA